MAQSHKCPCCHTTIWRREVKTCGSPQCLAEWRSLPLQARARMVELADSNDLTEINETITEISPDLKKVLFPTELGPKTELDKIFGKK